MNQVNIYKMSSPQTDLVFYGRTTGSLERCLNKEKTYFRMWQAGKFHYKTSFEVIVDEDCRIELVELFSYTEKRELAIRMQSYIKADKDSVNKQIIKLFLNADQNVVS